MEAILASSLLAPLDLVREFHKMPLLTVGKVPEPGAITLQPEKVRGSNLDHSNPLVEVEKNLVPEKPQTCGLAT